MQLTFENDAIVGNGTYPDFIQFPKTEGQLFFITGGLLYGTPSNRFNGEFSDPVWQETVYISPKNDTSLSNLELKSLSGFGIVGCFRTPYAQKLLIHEYMFEMDRYLDSGSIKCSMDTPITSFTLSLENPINENPEYEGNVAISEESSLLSPGSKVVFEFIIGDSEPYPIGTFYVDRSNFERLGESISVDGRNIIGKALGDQSFDEDNSYSYQLLHQTIRDILYKANISTDEMLVENTSLSAGYRACMGIMRLASSYPAEVVETASREAIDKGTCTYKYFSIILRQKALKETDVVSEKVISNTNLRGAKTYAGGGMNA